jgi:hypothetical protein
MGGFGVIPGWKIARELDRAAQQLRAIVGLVWEPFVQHAYDRNRASRLKVTTGSRPLAEKVLIYLLYQPDAILNSTIETCSLLENQGYSILIVSNAPLSTLSLDRLAAVSWQIIERPNYGYDFGGYRDGILHLMDQNIKPKWLMVMNDSVWYPLGQSDTLVRRLETSGLDVSGTIVHRNFRKTLLRRRATRVIESYLFLFNSKALGSKAFRDFWVNYRVSSNKYNAVHRGERKVAQRMLAGGLTADGLFSRDEFLTLIANQPDDFLRKTLVYAAYTDAELEEEGALILAEHSTSDSWRDRALAHIKRVTEKRNFHGAFVFGSSQLLDIPLLKKGTGTFLKRSYGTLYTRMRKQFVAAVQAGELPMPREEVLAEINKRDNITLRPIAESGTKTALADKSNDG